MRLLTSFLCCTFLKDNLVFISLFSLRTGVPDPLRSAVAGLGGAWPCPHLQNVLHTLTDELHINDVQQGGCWQHLAPETQWRDQAPRHSRPLQACQQCSLLDRGHDGDQRGQVSALSDPREHRAQPDLEGGQALGKHSDKVHGRAPGILQGWRNNLDIEQQKQAAQPSHFPFIAVFPAMGSLSYCPHKVIAEEPEL